MKLQLIRFHFKVLGVIAPNYVAKRAFTMFQTVRKKNIRPREMELFEKARHFTIFSLDETIDCYELGAENKEIAFLVHGIDSNAGSLSKIAFELEKSGKRVILFNLPGHAFSPSNKTNIFICKHAFKTLIDTINPQQPFSVYSHSFGSAVTAYTLANSNIKIDKLVLLSSPNSMEAIFEEFQRIVGLNAKVYQLLGGLAEDILGQKLTALQVDKLVPQIDYSELILIHDKHDKVLDFKNSIAIQAKSERSRIVSLENVGHYKMLWDNNVQQELSVLV
ncbi:alpha/beta fold hydrolase [Crocinitomix catalasitica]|uniref:alpha/beta fold hydrolase n=1 Tax=Crocinitomix catalasitica TaxID=184607 RepID=UPI000487716B|nr:alpha/beta fold hydrolase [Crocinitomix catalasitica]